MVTSCAGSVFTDMLLVVCENLKSIQRRVQVFGWLGATHKWTIETVNEVCYSDVSSLKTDYRKVFENGKSLNRGLELQLLIFIGDGFLRSLFLLYFSLSELSGIDLMACIIGICGRAGVLIKCFVAGEKAINVVSEACQDVVIFFAPFAFWSKRNTMLP